MITAAGVVNAEREIVVPLACLGSKATATVMDNSPRVLSLGKRCMQEGFLFVWNAGAKPVLVAPDGRRHTLELQNLVPVMPVRKMPGNGTNRWGDFEWRGSEGPLLHPLPETLDLRRLPEGQNTKGFMQAQKADFGNYIGQEG